MDGFHKRRHRQLPAPGGLGRLRGGAHIVVDVEVNQSNTGARPAIALGDATYKWRVIAEDEAGNEVESLTSRTVIVDTTPPVPPLLTQPADNLFTNNETPLFTWTASTSPDIDKYQLQVVSGDFGSGPIIFTADLAHTVTQFQTTVDLADATYQWRVIAFDKVTIVGPNTAASATRSCGPGVPKR